jgi:hypothetical protein
LLSNVNDHRAASDADVARMRAEANVLLDCFLDESWLVWAQPAGLMPVTQQRQRQSNAAEERRQAAFKDRKKLGTETKAAAAAAKLAPKKVERKGSKGSSLGLDFDRSETESAGTDKSGRVLRGARSEKSKVDAKADATSEETALWTAIKDDRIPAGYIKVSRQFFIDFFFFLKNAI